METQVTIRSRFDVNVRRGVWKPKSRPRCEHPNKATLEVDIYVRPSIKERQDGHMKTVRMIVSGYYSSDSLSKMKNETVHASDMVPGDVFKMVGGKRWFYLARTKDDIHYFGLVNSVRRMEPKTMDAYGMNVNNMGEVTRKIIK